MEKTKWIQHLGTGFRFVLENVHFLRTSCFQNVVCFQRSNCKTDIIRRTFDDFVKKKCRESKFRKILILTFHEKKKLVQMTKSFQVEIPHQLTQNGHIRNIFYLFHHATQLYWPHRVRSIHLPSTCVHAVRIFPSNSNFSVKKPISSPFSVPIWKCTVAKLPL